MRFGSFLTKYDPSLRNQFRKTDRRQCGPLKQGTNNIEKYLGAKRMPKALIRSQLGQVF